MKIDGKTRKCTLHWLALDEVAYTDNKGVHRTWEACSRTGKGTEGAAAMVARLVPSGKLILIRQFRPAAGRVMLEFPAGLIEPGEDPAVTAVRELKEETGFTGTVDFMTEACYSSCGLTPETIRIAFMTVKEEEQTDRNTCFDDGEDIETVLVPESGLPEFLQKEIRSGTGIDAKLMTWAMAKKMMNDER